MTGAQPHLYRGFEASCIVSAHNGRSYGHVINLPTDVVPFVFRRQQDYGPALKAAVEHYLATCRFDGRKPEKPIRSRKTSLAEDIKRVRAVLRKSRRR
ncbi:MAG: hypothetical protein ABJC74_17390 [Gemmatimonadota bacterium]